MNDTNRGVILNRERRQQIFTFAGLRYIRNITPTDIDGFIDLGDEAFIFFELKYRDAPVPPGQKMAYARLCDAVATLKRKSIVFIARYETADAEVDVDASIAIIAEYYYQKIWTPSDSKTTLEAGIKGFLNKNGLGKYCVDTNKYAAEDAELVRLYW